MSEPRTSPLTNSSLRYLLFPLALMYWGVIFWRNLFYTLGFFVTHKLPCQVISIGNISLGGTGKTPAVIYLAHLLQQRGKKVAILSRGYGRKTSGTVLVSDGQLLNDDWQSVGDEPYLMARQLPGTPVVVDENRYRGGIYIVRHFDPDLIILDDAFQHRRLERDVDIVLINARETVNNNKLIPFGRLREPWFHLRRADLIFWTKTNLASPPVSLKSRANKLPVSNYNSTIDPESELVGLHDRHKLAVIKQTSVIAVSAVGDPQGFERTLVQLDVKLKRHISYPDHHRYTADDILHIKLALTQEAVDYIITTEKDLLKFAALEMAGDLPLYSLPIQFVPSPGGKAALLRLIDDSENSAAP